MRIALCALTALVMSPAVMADPVSLNQAMKELSDRGAKSVRGALFMGSPHIQANLDDQGMTLRLTECLDDTYVCRVATFSSCREYTSLTHQEAMDLTNTYSGMSRSRGSAHVAGGAILGQKLCIRLRIDLHSEDRFDLADIFDWQLTMRDFFDYTDEAISGNLARSLLGSQ